MAEENNGNTRRASSEERKKLLRSKRQVSFQQGNDLIPLDLITKEEADSLHKSMHQPDGRPRKISIAHTKSKKKHHVSPSLDPVSLSAYNLLSFLSFLFHSTKIVYNPTSFYFVLTIYHSV